MKIIKEHKFILVLGIIILISVISLVIMFVISGNKNGKWIEGGEDTLAAYKARILADGNIELRINVSKLGEDRLCYMEENSDMCKIRDKGVSKKWHTYIIEPQANYNFVFQVGVYSKEDYEKMNSSEDGASNIQFEGLFVKVPQAKYHLNMSVLCDSEGKVTINEIVCFDNDIPDIKKDEITSNGCKIYYQVFDNQSVFGANVDIQGGKKGEWKFTTDKNLRVYYGYEDSGIIATIFIGSTEDIESTDESRENAYSEENVDLEGYQIPDSFESEVVLNHISGDTETPVLRLKVTCKDGNVVKVEKV